MTIIYEPLFGLIFWIIYAIIAFLLGYSVLGYKPKGLSKISIVVYYIAQVIFTVLWPLASLWHLGKEIKGQRREKEYMKFWTMFNAAMNQYHVILQEKALKEVEKATKDLENKDGI